jgi:hypothetical protein
VSATVTIDVRRHPSPHVVLDQLFPEELYRRACGAFPALDARADGRAGRDLLPGDPGYDVTVAQIPWSDVCGYLASPAFVGTLLEGFRPTMTEHRCLVDLDSYRLTPFVEPRALLQSPTLDLGDDDQNSLFTRIDFQESGPGYRRGIHCDHRRRIISGIVFFSDAIAQAMKGGEFVLHGPVGHEHPATISVAPRHNRAVFFLSSATSFHEAAQLESCRGTRRWLYYAISSKADVW